MGPTLLEPRVLVPSGAVLWRAEPRGPPRGLTKPQVRAWLIARLRGILPRATRRWHGHSPLPKGDTVAQRAATRPMPQRQGAGATQWTAGRTRVEEHDGSQAAQLRLVHVHVPHLGHELRQHPAKETGEGRGPRQTAPIPRPPAIPTGLKEPSVAPDGSGQGQGQTGEPPRQGPTSAHQACRTLGSLLHLERLCPWDCTPGACRLQRPCDSQAKVSQGPGHQGQVHCHQRLRCRPTG